MKIAAFDLSLTRPAVCVDGDLDVLNTKKLEGHERLAAILNWTQEWSHGCQLVAVEGYSYSSQASRAHAAGELGGLVRHAWWSWGRPYIEVPPASVKTYATGKGNASKDQVQDAAYRRGGDLYTGTSNDEADAWWIWALAMDLAGAPVIDLPLTHRRALDKLTLPAEVAA